VQSRRAFLSTTGAAAIIGGVSLAVSSPSAARAQDSGEQFPAFNPKGPAVTAPTLFIQTAKEKYAYRRFGKKGGVPLLLLQHFTGTLDNWDPALTSHLAAEHDVILFDNAGIGRSTGKVSTTMAGMAEHALAFVDALGISTCDVLGFSLGGAVAQQMVLDRPTVFRKIILAGTAPRGGEDVMHLDKPSVGKYFQDPSLKGYQILQKIFFTPSAHSQAAGQAFIDRLMLRGADRDPVSGQDVAQAQMAAFHEWDQPGGERFSELKRIQQPTLIVNGVNDQLISVKNSYFLEENLPNATLLVYPDSGHGAIFQWHEAFGRQANLFLASKSQYAAF
jgi:pimeloyl-ACP methyl ester carboxylesterase